MAVFVLLKQYRLSLAVEHEGRALARYEARAPLERASRQREGGDGLYAHGPPKPAGGPSK